MKNSGCCRLPCACSRARFKLQVNLYIPDSDGKKLDSAYKLAWIRGLKTTYYLRSLGATHVEKSTGDNEGSKLNAVKNNNDTKQCLIDDPECEACQ